MAVIATKILWRGRFYGELSIPLTFFFLNSNMSQFSDQSREIDNTLPVYKGQKLN